MALPARVDTAIVGAGQAGLTMSALLRDAGRDHVVLERRSTAGGSWSERWDSFRLVTPNWSASFPGYRYDGPDPDGFMPRDEIAARVTRYAGLINAPVVPNAGVARLHTTDAGGFRLETTQGPLDAREVVVAVGSFHTPHIPPIAGELPRRLLQLHSAAYRTESALPSGGVLVVGSGQSGVQIAEELHEAGRPTFLSVGSAGWLPRRYRGRDLFRWLGELFAGGAPLGISVPTVETLPDPRLRLAGNPQLSGHRGGRDVDLRRMASEGVRLLGRIEGVEGERLRLADDLEAKLRASVAFFEQRWRPMLDAYIASAAPDAPAHEPTLSAFAPARVDELDLARAGIATVIWTTGFRPDYRWIDLPIFDELGLPCQRRGVTDVPGLYFLGLLWQHTQVSATLLGPTVDAPPLLAAMGLPAPERPPTLRN